MTDKNDKAPPKRDGLPVKELHITTATGFEFTGLEGQRRIKAFSRDNMPEHRNKADVDITYVPALGGYMLLVDHPTRGMHRYFVPREHAAAEMED